jgi:hypothetical protein
MAHLARYSGGEFHDPNLTFRINGKIGDDKSVVCLRDISPSQ